MKYIATTTISCMSNTDRLDEYLNDGWEILHIGFLVTDGEGSFEVLLKTILEIDDEELAQK